MKLFLLAIPNAGVVINNSTDYRGELMFFHFPIGRHLKSCTKTSMFWVHLFSIQFICSFTSSMCILALLGNKYWFNYKNAESPQRKQITRKPTDENIIYFFIEDVPRTVLAEGGEYTHSFRRLIIICFMIQSIIVYKKGRYILESSWDFWVFYIKNIMKFDFSFLLLKK